MLGGTEEQMYLLAKFLPKDQFEITIACSKSTALNEWCARLIGIGCNIVRLNVIHKHDPRHFLYLKKLLPQFDLLHLHLWNPASCRWALAAAREIPTIITEHDPFPLSDFKQWLKKILSTSVKKVIVCSEAAQKIVHENFEMFHNKIALIRNGIDVETWRERVQSTNRDEVRAKIFGAKQRDTIVLCVAELNERKGQRYLIEACAALRETHPHIKLILAGTGPARLHYEKLAQQLNADCLFLGRRNNVAELMASADIFVLPSIREAFGLVILEAAIAQVPVIASNTGGIRELIKDNETGRLVAPQDSQALSLALKDMIENSWDCRKFATAARQVVEEHFDAKKMAEETAALYDEVLNQITN